MQNINYNLFIIKILVPFSSAAKPKRNKSATLTAPIDFFAPEEETEEKVEESMDDLQNHLKTVLGDSSNTSSSSKETV